MGEGWFKLCSTGVFIQLQKYVIRLTRVFIKWQRVTFLFLKLGKCNLVYIYMWHFHQFCCEYEWAIKTLLVVFTFFLAWMWKFLWFSLCFCRLGSRCLCPLHTWGGICQCVNYGANSTPVCATWSLQQGSRHLCDPSIFLLKHTFTFWLMCTPFVDMLYLWGPRQRE